MAPRRLLLCLGGLLGLATAFQPPFSPPRRAWPALGARSKGFDRQSLQEEDAPASMDVPLGEESRRDRRGRELLDVLTEEPVRFPTEKAERFAAMWNEPAAEEVAQLRLSSDASIERRLEALAEVVAKDDNDALRVFVNANMHLYGVAALRALSAMKLRALSAGEAEEARHFVTLRRKLMAAEASLTTVFHVDVLDRQAELGEVLGRTDVRNFVGDAACEILPTWVVIKAVTSAWEDKYTTDTMEAQVAMDKRVSAGEPRKLRIAEQKAIARAQSTMLAMQSMAKAFREEESFMAALPLCCQFLDAVEAQNIKAENLGTFADDFLGKETKGDLVIALKRLQSRLDTYRVTRSFRLYSWYIRNILEVLEPGPEAWDTTGNDRAKVVPYRITDGFSWQRSPSVPTRNWEALEENLELLKAGKGGNPEYLGYGDPSRDDDVSVLAVLGRAINPFQSQQDSRAQAGNKGLQPGVNADPLDAELPFGGDWLFLLDEARAEVPREPQLSQEELDEMVEEYDPESELRAKSREGDNQVDTSGAAPPPEG